jgi:hemoglobin-like flavoprotein
MMNDRRVLLRARQVSLLKQSFRQIDTDRVSVMFYNTLFEEYPATKNFFPSDITDLRAKLISVLELVVFSFVEVAYDQYQLQPEVLVPLRDLGSKHDKLNIGRELYPIANSLLVRVLRQSNETVFTWEVTQAWELALNHLSHAMLDDRMEPDQSTFRTLRETYSYIRKKLVQRFLL